MLCNYLIVLCLLYEKKVGHLCKCIEYSFASKLYLKHVKPDIHKVAPYVCSQGSRYCIVAG